MTKENLWQIIVGLVVTAICGVILNMSWAAAFPAVIVAIGWAGLRQTSAKSIDEGVEKPNFWKDFACVMAGAIAMGIIVIV